MASDDEKPSANNRLEILFFEDLASSRDLKDPEFTSKEIAKFAKLSHSRVLRILMESGVGRVRCEPNSTVKQKVVKFSELMSLAREFKWL